jgi:hypothetical protein
MNRTEKPGCHHHPGQKPQNYAARANFKAVSHGSIDTLPLSIPLRPRPAIFVAFDEQALAQTRLQLKDYLDFALWDVKSGRVSMPGHQARFLFELTYRLTFFYPCSPDLRAALGKYDRAIALPPMPAELADGPRGLKVWTLGHWPDESRRVLQSREVIYVNN